MRLKIGQNKNMEIDRNEKKEYSSQLRAKDTMIYHYLKLRD
jgi:hypothetical protein